ncbi:hypothetical protein M3611_28150, partial [Priestia megaterium]|nr:hypothetical protein [Priestia megaterium]
QLVESRIVIPVVVGSSPISHPNKFKHLQQKQADVLQVLEDEIPKFGRWKARARRSAGFFASLCAVRYLRG